MNHTEPIFEPLLVDVPTACLLLSVKRTKLFALLAEPDGLQRVKIGGKTLVTVSSIRALARASERLTELNPPIQLPQVQWNLPWLG